MAKPEMDEEPSSGSQKQLFDALRVMKVWEAVTNNVAFMSAPFLMPSLYARTGWVWGTGFVVFSAVLTYSTAIIIGEICNLHPHLHSYPILAEEAFARLGAGTGPPRRRQGVVARWLVLGIQFLCYYLTGIAELIYFEQYMAQLLPQSPLCQRGWLFVAALFCWPMMMIPTFKESRWAASVTLVLIFFNVAVFVYEVFLVQPWNCQPGPVQSRPGLPSIMHGVTGIAYAFGGHGTFPEQLREMEQPERWHVVVNWCYGILIPLYLGMSTLGYLAYGVNANANLNLNFANDAANMASIIAQTIQEFYYVYFSVLVLMLQVELALGVSPIHWCTNPAAAGGDGSTAEESDSSCSSGGGRGLCGPSSWEDWLSLRRLGVPPAGFRLLFRSLFLGSEVAIAWALIGGDGDSLLAVQALAGAVGYMALTYILPLIFGWVLLPRLSAVRCTWYAASAVVCVVIMFAGIYYDARELAESAGGFGADVECKIAAEAYADHPCLAAVGPDR